MISPLAELLLRAEEALNQDWVSEAEARELAISLLTAAATELEAERWSTELFTVVDVLQKVSAKVRDSSPVK